MNAACLIAAGAAAARRARENEQPIYTLPECCYHKIERPIVGAIKILNNDDVVVLNAYDSDSIDLRFRSVYAVDVLIRELESLKKSMLELEKVNR